MEASLFLVGWDFFRNSQSILTNERKLHQQAFLLIVCYLPNINQKFLTISPLVYWPVCNWFLQSSIDVYCHSFIPNIFFGIIWRQIRSLSFCPRVNLFLDNPTLMVVLDHIPPLLPVCAKFPLPVELFFCPYIYIHMYKHTISIWYENTFMKWTRL